jgi:hypothetical protein
LERIVILSRLRRAMRIATDDRRGSMMVEFAIVGPIFFLLLFVVFEVSYDAYLNEVLDTAVQATARQIQIGNTQATGEPDGTTRSNLINNYLCPNALGLLKCNNLYLRIERIDISACPGGSGTADLYDASSGSLPLSGNSLGLSLYGGTGSGGPTTCQYSTSVSGFCVAGPSNGTPEFIVLSAIYVAPSFLQRLIGDTVTYNGKTIRAMISNAAFVTEGFTSAYTGSSPC